MHHLSRVFHRACLVLLLALTLTARPVSAQDRIGRDSGLPIPRFVTLGSSKVFMRSGPGKEFPIKWVYARKGLPLLVIEESEDWRLLEDPDGEQGWIHTSLLAGKRTLMVRGAVAQLHRTPTTQSLVLALVEPGVIADLLNCQPDWCLVDIGDRRGWLARDGVWGVLDGESF